jgi:hypothetical protein
MNDVRKIVAVLCLTCAGMAGAATEFDDSIPLELAEIFLGIAPGAEGGVYADVVDGFPLVTLPANVTVLGSIDRQAQQTVYLRTELNAEEARTTLANLYANAGWQSLDMPGASARQAGFFGGDPASTFPTMLCHEELGNLQITARAGPDYTLLTLTSTGIQLFFSSQRCSEMVEARQQAELRQASYVNPLDDYMPRLELPREANLAGRGPGRTGSYGSSGDELQASTTLQIDWDLSAVHAHFASQLADQGWTADGNWESALLAGGSWTRSPSDDLNLLGVLSVVQKEAGNYLLKFQLISR